jgi:hypothetical protein
VQQENKGNSSNFSFQSALLYDESSFDNHKMPFLRNEVLRNEGSTLDSDDLEMSISFASISSNNSSSSANFGLEKCTLAKQQSNSSSIGLPSSYPRPPFRSMDNHSSATYCGTYSEDLDDFEEFQLHLEKSRTSAKPAVHPLLFSELPKTVTPEKQRRPAGRNQVVMSSTEDLQCMIFKSNQNRRRRNMALSSTTAIEQAVREELAMEPIISIVGKLAL